MAGLKVKIGADASQFERTMRGVRSEVGGVKKAILGIGAATGAILAVNKAFDGMRAAARGAFEFIKESSREAASIESLTMQFETLLGGAGNAKKRIEEITKFAASTPFEIKELAATSKLLQTLGGSLLATGDGLRMVGDAAAIAGQPIGEVGLHIGRVFNAITSGTSAGESVARLQELGLIGGDVKRSFEDLAKAQKSGKAATLSQSQALELLSGILSKTEGAMERLSTTTEGKLSNMRDNIDQLQVAFGTGFNDGLKDALDASNNFLPQLQDKFTEAGSIIGGAISNAVEGNIEAFKTIGRAIGEALKDGVKLAFYGNLSTTAGVLAGGAGEMSGFFKNIQLPGMTGKLLSRGFGAVERAAPGVMENIRSGRDATMSQGGAQILGNLQDALATLRSQTMSIQGLNGSTWRPAGPGESTPFVDQNGNRIVQILESMDRKLGDKTQFAN